MDPILAARKKNSALFFNVHKKEKPPESISGNLVPWFL